MYNVESSKIQLRIIYTLFNCLVSDDVVFFQHNFSFRSFFILKPYDF